MFEDSGRDVDGCLSSLREVEFRPGVGFNPSLDFLILFVFLFLREIEPTSLMGSWDMLETKFNQIVIR